MKDWGGVLYALLVIIALLVLLALVGVRFDVVMR
jgi:hypothetical protein